MAPDAKLDTLLSVQSHPTLALPTHHFLLLAHVDIQLEKKVAVLKTPTLQLENLREDAMQEFFRSTFETLAMAGGQTPNSP